MAIATYRKPATGRLRLRAFRMYPDSAGIIRLHARGRKRSVLNIHLTPAEADRLAKALTRAIA